MRNYFCEGQSSRQIKLMQAAYRALAKFVRAFYGKVYVQVFRVKLQLKNQQLSTFKLCVSKCSKYICCQFCCCAQLNTAHMTLVDFSGAFSPT